MDAVELAGSGHPGMPMGCAELGAYLFGEFLRFDPSYPKWPHRDRVILSVRHGSLWLYSLLASRWVSFAGIQLWGNLWEFCGNPPFSHPVKL